MGTLQQKTRTILQIVFGLLLIVGISYFTSRQTAEIVNVKTLKEVDLKLGELEQQISTDKIFGSFPSMVSPGDTITSADWNALVKTASSTNPYDLTFTGHPVFTQASSTYQTITNLWNTTGTIGTLTLTNDLTVANGGSGASTLTGILLGNGTSAFTATSSIGTNYLPNFGYGTVTSVAMTVPTGLTIGGTPITTNGTLALTLTSGYEIPTTASTTNYNTFFTIPSSRITDGTNLTWSSNTLNVDDPFSVTNLAATNASTTYLTATNLWNTTGTITTLTVTGGTMTNATSTLSQFIPAIAGLTLSATGQIGINTTTDNLLFKGSNSTEILSATSTVGFTIASTTASELVSIKYFDQPVIIKKVMCNVTGGTSFTFNLRYNNDITSDSALKVFSSDQAISTTTTMYAPAMANNTPAAGNVLWAIVSAVSGTVRYSACTIFYKL